MMCFVVMMLSVFQRIVGVEAERNFYESQLIILDTLEKVLNSVSVSEFYNLTEHGLASIYEKFLLNGFWCRRVALQALRRIRGA